MSLAYPTILANVVVSQYPYVETDEWLVAQSTIESGASVTKTQNVTLLKRFTLNYPTITRVDVTTIETFFDLVRARTGEFQFTDDNGLVWSHVRFDMDVLEIQYVEQNRFSMTVKLSAEMN